MSRRRVPPVIDGGVPPEAWDLEPIGPGDGSRRHRKKVSPETRARVYARDNYRCKNCGATEDLTIDHIKPLSKGGAHREGNMQTLCQPCNNEKADAVLRPKRTRQPRERRRSSRVTEAYLTILSAPDD